MVPIVNMDLTEEELETILESTLKVDPNLYQRFRDAQNKLCSVKTTMEENP